MIRTKYDQKSERKSKTLISVNLVNMPILVKSQRVNLSILMTSQLGQIYLFCNTNLNCFNIVYFLQGFRYCTKTHVSVKI